MIIHGLGVLFAWTWFIWPFVFAFCLVSAVSRAVQEAKDETPRNSQAHAFAAGLALAVMTGGFVALMAW